MTTQAQTIANLAATDFVSAIEIAYKTGFPSPSGFGTMEYIFDDNSVLSLRGRRVVSPAVQRSVYRDSCGDLDVRINGYNPEFLGAQPPVFGEDY